MINYLIGDATKPQGDGIKLIPHIVNDIGVWGAGFVMAISKKWNAPERMYREWYRCSFFDDPISMDNISFKLGDVQFVNVEEDMIAQHGIGRNLNGIPPIRYPALRKCLININDVLNRLKINGKVSLHCPKFGNGLAGGDWSIIEKMIEELIDEEFKVNIYELK